MRELVTCVSELPLFFSAVLFAGDLIDDSLGLFGGNGGILLRLGELTFII